jgi:hypothetical protein
VRQATTPFLCASGRSVDSGLGCSTSPSRMFAPKLAKAQRPKHGFLLHKNSRHKSSIPCCPGTVLSHLFPPRHLKEPSSKVTSHGIVQAILHALNFRNTGGGSSGGDGGAAAPAEQQQRGGSSSAAAAAATAAATTATHHPLLCWLHRQRHQPSAASQPYLAAVANNPRHQAQRGSSRQCLTAMQTRVRRPQKACQDPAGI